LWLLKVRSHVPQRSFLHYNMASADHRKYALVFPNRLGDKVHHVSVAEITAGAGNRIENGSGECRVKPPATRVLVAALAWKILGNVDSISAIDLGWTSSPGTELRIFIVF